MFGTIGISEILVIAAVALVILGPDKFPGHAKIAMRFIRDIRGYWDEAKRDITEELKPVKKEMRELEKYKPEDYLESMTMDDSEDTSYDGQGYPYGEEGSDTAPKKTSNASEATSEDPSETGSEQAEEPAPIPESSPEGTQPYEPEKDYADESQRFPD